MDIKGHRSRQHVGRHPKQAGAFVDVMEKGSYLVCLFQLCFGDPGDNFEALHPGTVINFWYVS